MDLNKLNFTSHFMYPADFGDPLMLHLDPPAGQTFEYPLK